MEMVQAVGTRILELSEAQTLTVQDLSARAGIPKAYLDDIISARTESDMYTLEFILAALQISPRTFFDSPLFEGAD